MKILAVIVTYYPDEELLRKNLDAFIEHVEEVMVWDNTPTNAVQNLSFLQRKEVKIFGEGKNYGISYALNFALRIATAGEFSHILTMDQDSCWMHFPDFLETIKEFNLSENICGPSIRKKFPEKMYYKVPYTITSGSLLCVKMLNEIGGFNESFFVDHVDMELCCRAKNFGYDTVIINTGTLVQRFGNPKQVSWRGKDRFFYSYPKSRHYEIMRNKVLMLRTFKFSWRYLVKVFITELFFLPFQIILYDDDKLKKIAAVYRGFISGFFVKVKERYKKTEIC